MKKSATLIAITLFILSCGNNNTPDVSHINVDITIGRFDKAFFDHADTNDLAKHIVMLQKQFPYFSNDFFQYILGLPTDIPADSADMIYSEIKRFYRLTRPLYDSIAPRFKNTDPLEKELELAFRHVKYYFPSYSVPQVVTYIGPFDAPGVAITANAVAIGLQLYAGKNFSFYTSVPGQELYPMYISRRFEPQYITPNTMKAVIEDVFPDKSAGRPLIEQMIEKGKRWYLLNKFLPETPDSLKTDYTNEQLKWVKANEGLIWNFVLKNTDIYTSDPAITKNYIGEAPSTEGMPDASPGNIGQWIGWRIIEEYVSKNPDITPEALMKQEARKIFTEAKYKPK